MGYAYRDMCRWCTVYRYGSNDSVNLRIMVSFACTQRRTKSRSAFKELEEAHVFRFYNIANTLPGTKFSIKQHLLK